MSHVSRGDECSWSIRTKRWIKDRPELVLRAHGDREPHVDARKRKE